MFEFERCDDRKHHLIFVDEGCGLLHTINSLSFLRRDNDCSEMPSGAVLVQGKRIPTITCFVERVVDRMEFSRFVSVNLSDTRDG